MLTSKDVSNTIREKKKDHLISNKSTNKKWGNKFFIASFCLLISIPLVTEVMNVKLADGPVKYYRKKAPLPQSPFKIFPYGTPVQKRVEMLYKDIIEYKKDYEAYFMDSFFFRDPLYDIYKNIKLRLFKSSPIPEKVVVGNDGWLFLSDKLGDVLSESKGIRRLDNDYMSLMAQKTIDHSNNLRRRGTNYYLAVAPNKHSVYGEHLPIKQSAEPTIFEDFKVRTKNKVNVIDLKRSYVDYTDHQLYGKANTHFNDFGAFLACNSILEEIRKVHPQVPLLSLDDYKADTTTLKIDELTRMMRVQREDLHIKFLNKHASRASLGASKLKIPTGPLVVASNYENRYTSNTNKLKVVFFGDSFLVPMRRFLSECFGESVFVGRPYFDQSVIDQEKPDIVVQEIVERNIDLILMWNG